VSYLERRFPICSAASLFSPRRYDASHLYPVPSLEQREIGRRAPVSGDGARAHNAHLNIMSACASPPAKARRPIPGPPRSQTLWKIDAPAQLISNIVPFHERAAKSISALPRILRPSEICIKFSVRHRCFPVLS